MTISKIKAKKILTLFTLAFVAAGFSGFFQNRTQASGFSGKIFTSLFNGQLVVGKFA